MESRDTIFGLYSLFLYNEAKINNVIVNLKQATQKQRIYVGLLGFRNSGTIENFIVNLANLFIILYIYIAKNAFILKIIT